MMDLISPRLLSALDDLGIDLIFEKMDRRGFYWPELNAIVMNEDILKTNDVNFGIAHELSHAIKKHDEIKSLYCSTFVSHSKIEFEADLTAIKMLIGIYLDETGMDYQQLNSSHFMEYYGIESRLYDTVAETLRTYRYA